MKKIKFIILASSLLLVACQIDNNIKTTPLNYIKPSILENNTNKVQLKIKSFSLRSLK